MTEEMEDGSLQLSKNQNLVEARDMETKYLATLRTELRLLRAKSTRRRRRMKSKEI
jgi:hypothetical protein